MRAVFISFLLVVDVCLGGEAAASGLWAVAAESALIRLPSEVEGSSGGGENEATESADPAEDSSRSAPSARAEASTDEAEPEGVGPNGDDAPESSTAPALSSANEATAPQEQPQELGMEGANASPLGGDITELDMSTLLDMPVEIAAKKETTIEAAPSIVTVFTRSDIVSLGAKTVLDLLVITPGFLEVAAIDSRNVASRGIHTSAAQHILIMIDGLPMNDVLLGAASPDHFSVQHAERVEIVRGPGSALYGANAFTGVVNIVTRDDLHGKSLLTQVEYGYPGAVNAALQGASTNSSGSSFIAAARFYLNEGTRAKIPGSEDVLLTRRGVNSSDGIQEGENLTAPRPSTPVHVEAYGPSFELFAKYKDVDRWQLRLDFARNEYLPQRTDTQTLVVAKKVAQRPVRSDTRSTVDLSKQWGETDDIGQLTMRGAAFLFSHDNRSQLIPGQFFDLAASEERPMIRGWSGEDIRFYLATEYSVDLPDLSIFKDTNLIAGVQSQYDILYDYDLTLCFADAESEFIDSRYSTLEEDRDYYCLEGAPFVNEGQKVDEWGNVIDSDLDHPGDGDDLLVGGFVQLTSKLPFDTGITLGARVDHNPDFGTMASPRFALAKSFADIFYLKLLYSRAFVAPPFLYRAGNAMGMYVGDEDIEPQSINSLDALLGLRVGNVRFEVDAYYNAIDDFITFDAFRLATTKRYRYANRGSLRLFGTEASLMAVLLDGRASGTLAGSWIKPLDGTDDEFLVDGKLGGPSKYPTWTASFVGNLRLFDRLRFNVQAQYYSRIPFELAEPIVFEDVFGTDFNVYSSKPASEYDTSALLFGLGLAYQLTDGLEIWSRVRNLLDADYYLTGAVSVPQRAPGRIIYAGVRYVY